MASVLVTLGLVVAVVEHYGQRPPANIYLRWDLPAPGKDIVHRMTFRIDGGDDGGEPCWNGSGTGIVYRRGDSIYEVNVDTGRERLLYRSAQPGLAWFSPVGNDHLALIGPGRGTMMVDLASGTVRYETTSIPGRAVYECRPPGAVLRAETEASVPATITFWRLTPQACVKQVAVLPDSVRDVEWWMWMCSGGGQGFVVSYGEGEAVGVAIPENEKPGRAPARIIARWPLGRAKETLVGGPFPGEVWADLALSPADPESGVRWAGEVWPLGDVVGGAAVLRIARVSPTGQVSPSVRVGAGHPPAQYSSPHASPGGPSFAVARREVGSPDGYGDVSVWRPGQGLQVIASWYSKPGRYGYPQWSPDGSRLLVEVGLDECHVFDIAAPSLDPEQWWRERRKTM